MRRSADLVKLASGLVAVALLAGCGKTTVLPEELIGKYRSADARYADRYLELTPGEVVLGLGEGREERFTILGVQRKLRKGKTFYRLLYRGSYGRDHLRFFEGDSDGEIFLENQPTVRWKKGASDS